ncbi:retrovirus-related pol polyprotein from transposon TNT 1-94 [Tanacetum coccineum]|uniref:Retrovirus-related pol polyprotein from transposon TNT 1-94 n=1 Tax=Tanacetum coccineum TaxID=301880 RepID=A0ABQ4Y3G9_9ASTR
MGTQTQHQKEVDDLIKHVNQKTYDYEDVRSQNQDHLMTISELKNKIKTFENGKNVNTKFDKSETTGTLLCVTPLPKNIAVKAMKVSNTKVNADRTSWKWSASGNEYLITSHQSLDMEIMFKNLEGGDLLTGSRESNLYTISISELSASSPVCLTSKATSTKSWLWHRRLSHLNFGTINQLTSKDLVDGLPKFKYDNDHLCLACEQGKRKKASFPSKLVPSTESKLELLHMDLYGPMRIESINGKKYILLIVDDYSRCT